jgi:hypothetical protein
MKTLLRSMFPALLVLRLADKTSPAMDKLYFYVRRMSLALERSKELLDGLEQHYLIRSVDDKDIEKKMFTYFVGNERDSIDVENELKKKDNNDSDSEYDDDSDININELEDNEEELSEVDTNDDDTTLSENENDVTKDTVGSKMITFWNKRKIKLVSDVAITAWMVSPMPEIMDDVKQHSGDDRNAVERLIKKWFSVTVSNLFSMNIVVSTLLT